MNLFIIEEFKTQLISSSSGEEGLKDKREDEYEQS